MNDQWYVSICHPLNGQWAQYMLEFLRDSEKGGGRGELCDMLLHSCYSSPCYRTFPVLGWACSFPSAQQACRSSFRVIYVGGPLKGPQLTTTADTLTPTRYCVLSLILFVNWNVFHKTGIRFCLIYSNKQWKMQKLIGVTTTLGVNSELHTNLFL